MSIHSTILLLLILCLLSMHACSSRPLSNKHSAQKKLPHSIKAGKVTTMLHSTTSKEKEVKVLKHHEGIDDASTTTGQKTNKEKISKDLRSLTKEVEAKKKMSNPAGVAQRDQSLVSVSFLIPRKKQGDRHPGFSLDYSPPKTHPPSHN
ncbi:hypothetical protein AQUCO_01300721v1 [Aquilegia coerulea]|uniref:Uncharacterized protein n=1 Tax=Aquilegia coerulea TaxID=218851 RepID=A0A2G5E317_AQUCA|nr:hypothetical protein AQUCO_01300721v1 [Aquilegia coerulea]